MPIISLFIKNKIVCKHCSRLLLYAIVLQPFFSADGLSVLKNCVLQKTARLVLLFFTVNSSHNFCCLYTFYTVFITHHGCFLNISLWITSALLYQQTLTITVFFISKHLNHKLMHNFAVFFFPFVDLFLYCFLAAKKEALRFRFSVSFIMRFSVCPFFPL